MKMMTSRQVEKCMVPILTEPPSGSGTDMYKTADQAADDLADDEPERIGAEHRDDRRGVESPDDGPLQDKSQRADRKWRRQHPEPDRQRPHCARYR